MELHHLICQRFTIIERLRVVDGAKGAITDRDTNADHDSMVVAMVCRDRQ